MAAIREVVSLYYRALTTDTALCVDQHCGDEAMAICNHGWGVEVKDRLLWDFAHTSTLSIQAVKLIYCISKNNCD